MLPILYQDDHLVAIHKPSNLLVHRTSLDAHERRFAVQLLRDQLGRRVYPAHRLDKGTSGILLFALDAQTAVFGSLYNGLCKRMMGFFFGGSCEGQQGSL